MPDIFGATRDDWRALATACPITDLLPVVSNPDAKISSRSKLTALGKTPSRYYGDGTAGGIQQWTQYPATKEDINSWAKQPDYGICVQTRLVRAIDVDIKDPAQAATVFALLEPLKLPKRMRANSSKFLLAFRMPGEFAKRTIKTSHGIVEFLANGQQFIAAGSHFNNDGTPSGARYQWLGGTPIEIPTLTQEQFEQLWTDLQTQFGVAPAKAAKTATVSKQVKLQEANENDETAKRLFEIGSVLSTERDGRLHITCPFAGEHTGEGADSASTYFPANTGGYALGHFKCLHAHCEHRLDSDFRAAIGLEEVSFEPVTEVKSAQEKTEILVPEKQVSKFTVHTLEDFGQTEKIEWLIRGLLPKAELGVIFGAPGSGKTFLALDLVGAMTAHRPWFDLPVRKSRGVYVIAEGSHGFRQRIAAYRKAKPNDELDFGIINAAPNLLNAGDVKLLIEQIHKYQPKLDWIVIDTLAASTPGANENSGEDMGKVLDHCKAISRHTGAMVLLVHHSGKDDSKGARGWSGIRGAVDVEIEVSRCGDKANTRCATLTKLKDGGEDGREWYFRLDVVHMGTEVFEGEEYPITSCVVGKADKPVMVSSTQEEDLRALITATLENAISHSSFEFAPSVQDMVDMTVAVMDPPKGKVDTRGRKVRKVLGDMTDVISLDDGRVAFLSPEEKKTAAKAAGKWELLSDEDMLATLL